MERQGSFLHLWDSQISAQDNPRMHDKIPLYSKNVIVWCEFTATFILGPFFFEKITARDSVTCSITVLRYHYIPQTIVVPQLQQKWVLTSTVFMQDGAPPHIHESVKALLQQHFTDERVISRFFRNPWPPRSPDSNPSVSGYGTTKKVWYIMEVF